MIHYQHGLPEHLRPQAVALYWHAFGGKLGTVMGPAPKALHFLTRVLRANHAIVALDDAGNLLGMAGFKTAAGSFAGGEIADIRHVYGSFGAAWRLPLLWMLSDDEQAHFLLDGICVAPAARGLGIGSALMTAIEAEARARGYASVRLDVIDSNWRAKALYQRLGYRVAKIQNLGMLRHAFGFRAAITMVKML
ncbi:molybdopterin-guanine dinucleotide biosynthesis protein MobC [Cypionkella aquatica]|uniref:Molybdopterin-guanine dinucleotide biosynthesis protein MobC n=1 Tax=Cypionkella aquatica TaxID=1756042 RepID=A0AA37TU26_9RHOB|nr:N-acetyltransferase [Cypionkella aquatica]GLS87523.1 molybdopterin-guanine dinucleotide biosynthesis protein MobC [Cypionkella aquatica]